MSKPYPNLPPNKTAVQTIGGLTRTCFVLELRSFGALSDIQLALVKERLEACVNNILPIISVIESSTIASDDSFDRLLRDGLRLPNN